MKTLAIVVPCYNEEAVLNETNRRLLDVGRSISEHHPDMQTLLLYVDDGSTDSTWDIISELSRKCVPHVAGIRLAHNAGHQNALWAGLEAAVERAEAVVSIDADLQDDTEAIIRMADCFCGGADIVYGVRRERATDTWFKRTTAQAFYKMMRTLGGDVVYNHADFRLMSRRALKALLAHSERNLFLRGLVRRLGFREGTVEYDRARRFAGESKYPFRKMLSFALDGITSFSIRPLRLIVFAGLLFIFVSLAVIVWGLVAYFAGRSVAGWTSLFVSMWFIGGCILVAMGIIGEYVGKIYSEVKRRPRYFIDTEVWP